MRRREVDPSRLHLDKRANELEEYYETEIHHGRLYPNLDTLIDKGLVEKSSMDRRTNLYKLTARGQRELEVRQEWEQQYLRDTISAA